MNRRDFLKLTSASGLFFGSGSLTWASKPPSPEALYARFVPADKGLKADWLDSLTQRGHPLDAGISYRKSEVDLEVIGITVGGIACGSVYLSGDGQLWVWDIFNQHHEGIVANSKAKAPDGLGNINNRSPRERDGANFLLPPKAAEHKNGVDAHFTLNYGQTSKRLDASAWEQVQFTGRWPVGLVEFAEDACPLSVKLKAFSPFIPLNLKDSSLPASILEYRVENLTKQPLEVSLTGHLNNALGQFSKLESLRKTKTITGEAFQGIQHTLEAETPIPGRPDLPLFDFESGSYEGWKMEGSAFGEAPLTIDDAPSYQKPLQQQGQRLVNSHGSATGSVGERDQATGKLTSPEFKIERKFLNFLIGGGKRPDKLCVALMVEGKVILSATGHNANAMRLESFDLNGQLGKKARILIKDDFTGGWGNIGADDFVLSDRRATATPLEKQLDFGSMTLAILGKEHAETDPARHRVSASATIPAKGSHTFRFAIAWHLPNLNPKAPLKIHKRHYSAKFSNAEAVTRYLARERDRLIGLTHDWVRTWNDSTLPQWLLDRTLLTANTLQTQNCLIQSDGRFWAWEGIGCCPGTCGHVWEYAQGHARLFPEIERNLREVTDYGEAQDTSGAISFRAPLHHMHSIDAQAGYILRTLRDHQLSDDPAYLMRIWPHAKRALDYLIEFDKSDGRGGLDGLLDGRQHNTLDAEWYGKVHVLCSMYLAALRAGEELAKDANDQRYAKHCREIFTMGRRNIAWLFNGEFYEQLEDPKHLNAIGVGKGCYIDQVMGQFWSNQLGLGRLYSAENQKSALRSLWKYNFVPEYGSFRQGFPEGRHYAGKGDSGLLMCTWPKGGLREDFKQHWQYSYFNEFMTGFEYQVAAHMIAEGDEDLVRKGLAITRSIHDRYSARRGRNPYNEIECSDHYARAGASYAVFLALCGFEFHQAKGHIAFNPVIQKKNFRAPFITSQAWGNYEQTPKRAAIEMRYGTLVIKKLEIPALEGRVTRLLLNGEAARLPVTLNAGDHLEISR